jgi:hypothetical protein
MSTNLHSSIAAQSEEACIDPAVGSLLPDYIVDLLEETAAEQVDQHLIDCQTCKEKYLAILRICHTTCEVKTAQATRMVRSHSTRGCGS